MFSTALTLLLALAAADDKGPVGVNVTTSNAAERISLAPLRGPIELVSDPYAGRIELRTKKPEPRLAAQISRSAGTICPTVKLIGATIELTCRTHRFDALLSGEGAKRFLDIQELRGLPWRAGIAGPPFFHYEPFRTGLGSLCPGGSALSRGECALLDGRLLEAATQFRSTVDTGDGQMAALRLGDMALSTGDPATALGWYRRAGEVGSFGRMARARICEIDGNCLESPELMKRIFDPRGLADSLRAEMTVRAVRVEALEGRLSSATRMLWEMIRGGSLAWLCREGGEPICRRVLLQYMREAAAAPDPGEGVKAAPSTTAAAPAIAPAAPPAPQAPLAAAATTTTTTATTTTTTVTATTPTAAPSTTAAKASPAVPRNAPPAPRAEPSEAEMAIEIYLSLPSWDHGPLAPELSEAAADLAGRLGAPVFGGNLLSAVAPDVGDEMLPAHLVRAAELYLDGDDIARTRLVIEYARTRIGKRIQSSRWTALDKRLAARVAQEDGPAVEPPLKNTIDPEAISRELTAARAASTRAQLARGESAPRKQGDQR